MGTQSFIHQECPVYGAPSARLSLHIDWSTMRLMAWVLNSPTWKVAVVVLECMAFFEALFIGWIYFTKCTILTQNHFSNDQSWRDRYIINSLSSFIHQLWVFENFFFITLEFVPTLIHSNQRRGPQIQGPPGQPRLDQSDRIDGGICENSKAVS